MRPRGKERLDCVCIRYLRLYGGGEGEERGQHRGTGEIVGARERGVRRTSWWLDREGATERQSGGE